MEKDYNEILLQAIDTVVSTRLQNLPYDKTIICTISDDSNRSIGLYEVDDGSATFEVYSDSDSYLLGNQVYVNIPQGDMTQKKHITGRYVSDIENSPIIYVEPLEKVVRLEDGFTTIPSDKPIGIIANGSKDPNKPTVKPIGTVTNLNIDTEISDTLAIRAKFKTDLENVAMTKGSYGLLVELYYTETVEETDEESGTIQKTVEKMVPVLLDSQQDMFGNVYAYTVPLMQQQAHKFTSPIGPITEIQCSLYERGDFKCLNQDGDEVIYNSQGVENIFVSDIEIYFGTDISTVPDNTVKIYTHDPKVYFKSDDENNSLERKISLIWYNKTAENKLLGFDGEFDQEKATKTPNAESALDIKNYYWIEWYRDNLNGSLEKIESGGEEAQTITGECELKLPRTEFQARVWLNGTVYKSNILEFSNTTQPDEETISFMGAELSLTHGEGSQDAYPVYGENGHVINQNDYYKKRNLKLSWSSQKAEIKDEFWKGATITWRIPTNSMLRPADREITKNEAETEWIYSYQLTDDYYNEDNALEESALQFAYCIAERYDVSYVNNTITCELKLKDEKLTVTKTFAFSARGTYGTDYTIIVKPNDERLFGFKIENDDDNGTTLQDFTATLYDKDSKEMSNKVIIERHEPPRGWKEELPFAYEGYNVIKASAEVQWQGQTVNIATLYPVIYSSKHEYTAQVPTNILYDAFGTLKSLNSGFELKLFDSNNDLVTAAKWTVKYSEKIEATNTLLKFLPKVGENNTLIVLNNYIDTGIDSYLQAAIVDQEGKETVLWTSPLIIQQYKYESEILNNWDGSLQINDKENLVLAGAAVFGKKDSANSFSGVALGDLSKVSDAETTHLETGLLGFHKGVQSYGFRDDGTAFIGKSGAGRIHFDGDQGIIASDSWYDSGQPKPTYGSEDNYLGPTEGMKIDLTNGALYADAKDSYLYFNESGLKIGFGSNKSNPQVAIGKNAENIDVLGQGYGIKVDTKENSNKAVFIGSTGIYGTHGQKIFHAGYTQGPSIVDADGLAVTTDALAFQLYDDGYFYAPKGQIGGIPPITAQQRIIINSPSGNQLYKNVTDFQLSAYLNVQSTRRFDNTNRPFVIESYKWQYWKDNEWHDIAAATGAVTPVSKGEFTSCDTTFTFTDNDFLTWFVGPNTNASQIIEDISGRFKISVTAGQWEEQGQYNEAKTEINWYPYNTDGKNGIELQEKFTEKDLSNEIIITRVSDKEGKFTVTYYKRTKDRSAPPDYPQGVTFLQQEDDKTNGWYRSAPTVTLDENNNPVNPFLWSTSTTLDYTMKNIVATDWSVPILMTDVTGKFDVEYAFKEYDVGTPDTDTKQDTWFDPAGLTEARLAEAIWMATRSSDDGGAHWSKWAVTRIKGQDTYVIELDNDSDVIAMANGQAIGLPITVTVKRYKGINEVTSGSLSISSAPSGVTYTFSNNQLSISALSTNFTGGEFVFTWTLNSNTITKKFRLAVVKSAVDWNLILDKIVINTNDNTANRTVTIKVQKVTANENIIYNLTDIPNNEVYVVTNPNSGYNSRLTSNSKELSSNTTFYLKQRYTTGSINANFQWDVETVSVVQNGTNGKGITEVIEYYRKSSSSTKADQDGNQTSWSTTVPTLDATYKYLWNYEQIKYTFGNPTNTAPALIGVFGKDGNPGRGISQIEETYAANNSSTTPPTSFSTLATAMASFNATNKYLWNKETITYTSGTPASQTFTTVIAVHGQDGQPGGKGDPGPAGTTGTKTEAVRIFYITDSKSPPELPAGAPETLSFNDILQDRYQKVWITNELDATQSYPYMFTSTGVKTTTYNGTTPNTPMYGSWTTPILYRAYNNFGIDQLNYATYLRITNFSVDDGLYYDTDTDGVNKLMINASFIKTGSLVVGTNIGQEDENIMLSVDTGENGDGAFKAKNLTIEASYFHASPGKFVFGDDEDHSYFNFSINPEGENSTPTSYIQSVNYGMSTSQSIYVVDLGATARSGVIRSNGMNTTKLSSYGATQTGIYLCLQKVPGTEDQYTYITSSSTPIKSGLGTENRLYGRWLKCIYGLTRNNSGEIVGWRYGYVYPGGSDASATWTTILPGALKADGSTCASYKDAAANNARLGNYLSINANSMPTDVTSLTLVSTNTGGSKLDLYNGTFSYSGGGSLDLKNKTLTLGNIQLTSGGTHLIDLGSFYITKTGYSNIKPQNAYRADRVVATKVKHLTQVVDQNDNWVNIYTYKISTGDDTSIQVLGL